MPSHLSSPGHDQSPSRLVPDRRGALLIGACGLVLLLVLLVLTIRGDEHSPGDESASRETPVVGHIHGIGVDPADGGVYVGAHFGVFSVTQAGEVRPVGEERHDTMAFTVVGPGHFAASGHPDMATGGPVHLGLIETQDAARSWQSKSLSGAADFHALEVTDHRTWGVDTARGRLLTSLDRVEWNDVASGGFIDLAVDPSSSDEVLVTSDRGAVLTYNVSGTVSPLSGAPTLAYVDWPSADQLVGLESDGSVQVSGDSGATWTTAGRVPGTPSALEVSPTRWYAATDTGLFSSEDQGVSWDAWFTYDGAS